MINKIIHYCWFGYGEKSELIKRCIESWKIYCPDFKIIEWNEKNFDVTKNQFVSEAYNSKKWAFVSDYVRLEVLNQFGGIYLDTDLELRESLEKFLKYEFFCGKETEDSIMTALLGANKGNKLISEFLGVYKNRSFVKNKELDITPNTKILTDVLKRNGVWNNSCEKIYLSENEIVFGVHYFCYEIRNKKNFAIHHFEGEWVPRSILKEEMLLYKNQYNILNKILELNYDYCAREKIYKSLVNKKICIYGFGSIGKAIEKLFMENNFINYEVYDEKIKNANKNFDGNIEALKKNFDIILITPWKYFEIIQNEVESEKCINIFEFLELEISKF